MRRMKTSLDFRPPEGAQWTPQTTEHVPYSKRDSKQSETTPSKYHVTYCRLQTEQNVFKNWNNWKYVAGPLIRTALLSSGADRNFLKIIHIQVVFELSFLAPQASLQDNPVKSYIITAIFVFYSYVDISTLSMYFIDFVKLASGSICWFLKSFVFDLYGDYVICK